jgi:hypothetical protein
MATGSGSGLTREHGEFWNMQVINASSFDDSGYVLKYEVESSTNKVSLCGSTDIPACVNYRSTRDPFDFNEPSTLELIGSEIGEAGIPVFAEGWAKLQLATNNQVITRGDSLICTGSGKVDQYGTGNSTKTALPDSSVTNSSNEVDARLKELAQIVGRAEETVVAGTTAAAAGTGKILCKLSIGTVGQG